MNRSSQLLLLDSAALLADHVRQQSQTIALVNGCFDPIHHGHIAMLQQAKLQADWLFVAINSDQSIRQLKGEDRPRYPLDARVNSLLELRCVDVVIAFNQPTPAEVIRRVRPTVVVKGSDYDAGTTVERAVIEEVGAHLHFANFIDGVSSTAVVSGNFRSSSVHGSKVHLVADYALDTYMRGPVHEYSREFPHPVCVNASEEHRLGAGANLAVSLARQSKLATLIGVVGDSAVDEAVQRLLDDLSVQELKLSKAKYPYCTNYRKVTLLHPGHAAQEVLRLDQVPERADIESTWLAVISDIEQARLTAGDVIVASAYERPERSTVGLVVRKFMQELAAQRKVRLIGSCRHDSRSLRGFEFVVLNEPECIGAMGGGVWSGLTIDMLKDFGRQMSPSSLVVTLGERGAMVYDSSSQEVEWISTVACPPGTDPTGAGDVFLARLAAEISRGASLHGAATAAVRCATRALAQATRPAIAEYLLNDE